MNPKHLKENVKHGDDMFPLQVYHRTLIKGIEDLILHFHDEIEFICIENGYGIFNIGYRNFEVKKGDILIINKSTLHSGFGSKETGCECKTLVFSLNMLTSTDLDSCQIKYILPLIKEELNFLTHITNNHSGYDEFNELIHKIFMEFKEKEAAYEIRIKGLILQLLANLYRYDQIDKYINSNKLDLEKINKIKIVIKYISDNIDNKILIKNLSSLINYSEYHFIRFFKEQTGMTCVEYINHIRLYNSVKLLLNTDNSITEISFKVGFNNVSYFNKKFKEKYGITPIQYKKTYKVYSANLYT